MLNWLKGRLGMAVAVGVIAVALVGGLAFAITGSLSSSGTSTPASASALSLQTGAGLAASACSSTSSGTSAGQTAAGLLASGGSSSPKATCKGGRGILRRLLGRTVHASLVVRAKGGAYVTVDLDRGTVESISSSSITIKRADGVTVSATVTSATHFLRTTEAALTSGDRVVVVQTGGDARYVIGLRAKVSSGGSSGSGSSGGSGTSSKPPAS